jgi:acyl carrier protein
MSRDAIPEVLRQVFASVLEIDAQQVTLDMNPQTCGEWDSMKNMELIIAVESAFGKRFTAADIAGLDSVRGYCDALTKEGLVAMA